jgi:uncharacterized membrane protein SpoIIM required for sporulation
MPPRAEESKALGGLLLWHNHPMALVPTEQRSIEQLASLVERAGRRMEALSDGDLAQLPLLYRHVSSLHARLETTGDDPRSLDELRRVVASAHALLYRPLARDPLPLPVRTWRYFMVRSPRALRREWRLLVFSFGLFYGFVVLSWVLVSNDLGMAFALLDPGIVARTLEQLEALDPGQPFRGNFTFGLGESPGVAGQIMANNLGVSVLFFASGLVPPLFLFVVGSNGLMVGTYTAVAGHYGQAGQISSTLWCHGALELQAIVLAGLGGLILVRGWVMPGPWSRTHAMRLESRRAVAVLAPVLPMLVVAGLIEAFVSPHAPFATRVATAIASGGLFLAWLLFAGRGPRGVAERSRGDLVPARG